MAKAKQKTAKPQPKFNTALERGLGFQLDTVPDRIDIRDWFYEPTLEPLPDSLVHCHRVPQVLDQGSEGACTGFALGAVINFLLAQHGRKHGVSPRMLYELARRYDEWPGEDYEGASARGAMKGWVRHGVCRRKTWQDDQHGPGHFSAQIAQEGMLTPGGAYYRVKHREVRHMHAALNETGILYVTLMVHEGWLRPGPTTVPVNFVRNGKKASLKLPVITRKGRAESGHAVALVGYTQQGFIVQNSWGTSWGAGGFALLPYEDFLLHSTDVWVSQLGVPVSMDLWAQGKQQADSTSGMYRATRSISLDEIRPYVIDVANNGELSNSGDYWTTEEDLGRLFSQTIPECTKSWKKRRVLLYLHGGLNSERDAAKRVMAMRDVLLDNEIYPLHVMWESDFFSSTANIFKDQFTVADERAGGGFLENLGEARDRVLELTVALPAGALWGEMKENAELASAHRDQRGAMQLVAKYVELAKQGLGKKSGSEWELHVVGHSAGSIFAAHAMPILTGLGMPLKSVQFLAPAIRCDLFRDTLLKGIQKGDLPLPSLFILSDELEKDDTVGPYGKSLLYLVSNAFEGKRGVPLLGMKNFIDADPGLRKLFGAKVGAHPALVVAGQGGPDGSRSNSRSHGGFDNDPDTLNSVLIRILGGAPKRPFTERDLKY